jgi:hypothetical protein
MNTTDLLKGGEIVDILKLGLSGLVFLLALLSLRLLMKAQTSRPNVNVLRAIRTYMIHTTILAMLVAATSLVPD